MCAAARVAGSCASALSATDLAIMKHATGRCAQPSGITQRPRLVVCEVGFLIRDTCTGDEAVGSSGAARHCLARSLR